jgi:H+/Cl- antiporter ClcA
LVLLVVVAVLGAPIAAIAYWFLVLVNEMQKWIYNPDYLPQWLGFHGVPIWWPLPMLAIAGVIVGLTIEYLPGRGGPVPADGLHTGGALPANVPGIALAALAGLALGAVIGPEAPLIGLGAGLAVAAVKAVKRDAPAQSVMVIGAAGSFAAISTLLGSPLPGAFLLMEASGLGGPMMGLVLVPGLLAAGIGAMVFVGFDSWTGHGTFSLAIPNIAHVGPPTGSEFGWAILAGIAATLLGGGLRWLGLYVKGIAESRILYVAPIAGLGVAGLAIAYAEATGKSSSQVLFSGQSALPSLVTNSATYTVGALLMLLLCKGLAYSLSIGSFRGGPTFPAMFVGAAGGIAMSHLPGLQEVSGAAIGIGAMTVAILNLPLTAVLLTAIFMGTDGLPTMPLVIVAVVVAYVGRAHFSPQPRVAGSEEVRREPAVEATA